MIIRITSMTMITITHIPTNTKVSMRKVIHMIIAIVIVMAKARAKWDCGCSASQLYSMQPLLY
ncbi:hypothetical protein D3C78_1003760 [compost metagenome]